MKWQEKFLSTNHRKEIESKITQFEKETGTELTICIARSSDPYPAAPLRFSLYFAIVSAAVLSYFYSLPHDYMWPLLVFLLTLPGAFIGGFPGLKKYMLADIEVKREVNEKALEVFYQYAVSKTDHNNNVLIYLSLLEKKLIILVDENLKNDLGQDKLEGFAKKLQSDMKSGNNFSALSNIVDQFQEKVVKNIDTEKFSSEDNQLKDHIIFLDFAH